MNRRDFLTGAAAGVVVGAGGAYLATKGDALAPSKKAEAPAPAPAVAKAARELKMVTTWPKNFPGLGTAAERFARRIADMSGGEITIKVFAAGELVPPFESFDAVSTGTADMYHAADYYWQGKSKAFNFFTAVPFGLNADEISAWIEQAGGQALWDELAAGFGIKPLLCGNTGVQMGGWFNKEINSLEDIKGLKMRMPGLGGEVLRRLGATVVNLPGGEIFSSLQSGAIDATEWVGPWNDLAFGFHKVTKFYYYPGFHEPGSALSLGINLKVWQGFTDSQRQLFAAAAGAENATVLAEFNAKNGDALKTLTGVHKVQVRKFSDEIMQAIGDASGAVLAEIGASDPMTKKVYDSFLKFRQDAMAWTEMSETAYAAARALKYKFG